LPWIKQYNEISDNHRPEGDVLSLPQDLMLISLIA
jgi:hypothetical protein